MNAVEVLQEFADAAKAPSGRRHFDALDGVANRDPKPAKDWAAYVAERQARRGPDECWPWRGGVRITIEDGRRWNGTKNVQARPSKSVEFKRLVWMVCHDMRSPRFVYSTCTDRWCSNPRHLTDKTKERPQRKVVFMSAKSSTRTVPALRSVAQPMTGPEVTHVAIDGANALVTVLQVLGPLPADERERVLRALEAYYR